MLEVLVVSSCPSPGGFNLSYFLCSWAVSLGLAGHWLPWSCWVKLRQRGGSDLLEEHHLGKAPSLYEGLVVGRSCWKQRQNCILKCGILINEQMGK